MHKSDCNSCYMTRQVHSCYIKQFFSAFTIAELCAFFRILLFYYVMFVYKLAYTETLKIKIISNLQNENARRFFCSYQSTRSLANQNACFKSCFYVKAASLFYDDIIQNILLAANPSIAFLQKAS